MSSTSYRYTLGDAFSYDEEGLDLSQPLTYNSSFHRANVTLTLAEAPPRLVMLNKQHAKLTEELRLVGGVGWGGMEVGLCCAAFAWLCPA